MYVAILCETSGEVRRAFRARHHMAISFDLCPAQDHPPAGHHHTGDLTAQLSCWHSGIGSTPDLIIAHPPCTYLCNSGVGRLHHIPLHPSPGVLYGGARWRAMEEAAAFVSRILTLPVDQIVVENPVMHHYARHQVGSRASQTIQPYQFGDDASKRTGLWLKNLPVLQPLPTTQWAIPRRVCATCGGTQVLTHPCCQNPRLRPRWANQTDSGQNKLTPSADRAQRRSRTYPGIARAMAEQWGK